MGVDRENNVRFPRKICAVVHCIYQKENLLAENLFLVIKGY
jgi:hypothetical protein